MAHVAILGGGFGGVAAAHELKTLLSGGQHSITLIDRSDRFFAGLAKLWDVIGRRRLEDGSRPLARLNDRGIRYVQSDITRIDADAKSVQVGDQTVEADFLLVALGAACAATDGVTLAPPAHSLFDPQALPAIRRALQRLERGRVVISVLGVPYPCPPSPYEAALLIDDWLRRHDRRSAVDVEVTTPQPSPLPIAGAEVSGQIAGQLERRGIGLAVEREVRTVDPDDRTITFRDGGRRDFDLLLAVPQHVVPPVIAESLLAGRGGWVEPDRGTMRTSSHGVYAVGDCTSIPLPGGELPKTGQFAEIEGRVAARNIAAEVTGVDGARFEGRGYCFLEVGSDRASYLDGDFFADPRPRIAISRPDEKSFHEKEAFERQRLHAWFGR